MLEIMASATGPKTTILGTQQSLANVIAMIPDAEVTLR